MPKSDYKATKRIGQAIQLIGLVICSMGIGFELGIGGDIFYLLISGGAVIFAVGTKLRGD